MVLSTTYASFPVNKKSADTQQMTEQTVDAFSAVEIDGAVVFADAAEAISPAVAAPSDDNTMIITILLWFFLGGLAAHRWYAGKSAGLNILFIITLGGLGIWWLVDGINILTDKF